MLIKAGLNLPTKSGYHRHSGKAKLLKTTGVGTTFCLLRVLKFKGGFCISVSELGNGYFSLPS